MRVFLLSVCVVLIGCSTAMERDPIGSPTPADLQALPGLEQLVEGGNRDQALQQLEELRWEHSRQVAYERLRQDLRVQRGQRPDVLEELDRWQEDWPEEPDLAYLRARQLEDPVNRYAQFRELLRRFPQHIWIRHGAIVTAQQMGDWNRSATWLETLTRDLALAETAEQAPASRRLRLLLARQANHAEDHKTAFRLLAADAFTHLDLRALQEYLNTAKLAEDAKRIRRAEQEFLIRAATSMELPADEAIDLAFARLLAEWPWCGHRSLEEVLQTFDAQLERLGAPHGWAVQPLYDLLGVARLVMPESNSGEVSRAFSTHGRALLAGSAWGRGNEIHLLSGTTHLNLTWPGHTEPVEVILAASVESSVGRTAQGGSVFRGFYMLLDSVQRATTRLESRLQDFRTEGRIHLRGGASTRREGTLESLDLSQRLRLRVLEQSGLTVHQLELQNLALHEAGHFGEVLDWIDHGLPVPGIVPQMLSSRQRYGDPILWLEYRAQLRCLAADPWAAWSLAEIVERAQSPRDPYYAPYRHILIDLLAQADAEGWPPLASWDQKSDAEIAALAARLCAAKGIQPQPQAGSRILLEALRQTDVFDPPPVDREAPDQVDQD